jgi:hypothetical protein
MAKRIAALVLAALTCILLVGCSADEAPDGMKISSLEGEPFKLYVPKEWKENLSSGISSAYYSTSETVGVSARYHTPADADLTLDAYVDGIIADCAQNLELFELKSKDASVLGGADARLLVYTAKSGAESYTYRQYVVKHATDFISLNMYSPTEKYDSHTEQFDRIAAEFVLCDRADAVNDCVTDGKTPDGMKIASSDSVEYRFYVPTSWVCNSESGVSETYYPESGKPNVTVISHSPDKAMTAQQYFDSCQKDYAEQIKGYALLSSQDATVAGIAGRAFTYSAEYSDAKIRIMQTVVVYNEMVYSITYTALDDSFEAHLGDVEAMI